MKYLIKSNLPEYILQLVMQKKYYMYFIAGTFLNYNMVRPGSPINLFQK